MGQHFWEKANIPSLWKYLKAAISPKRAPYRIERKPAYSTVSPTECEYIVAVEDDAEKLAAFLQKNYQTGSSKELSPKCTISSNWIRQQITCGSIFLIVYETAGPTSQIAGCIAASKLGQIKPSNITIRLIREFCISPKWRKKGLGSYLLLKIWDVLKVLNEDSVLFLKEGRPITSAGPTLHTGMWIYSLFKYSETMEQLKTIRNVFVVPWIVQESYIKKFSEYSNISLYNSYSSEGKNSDTIVLNYKGFRGEILAAFTNAWQQIEGNNIWYMTGWLSKGELLDAERYQAAENFGSILSSLAATDVAVWLDSKVLAVNSQLTAKWKKDGPFHWYAFQWSAGIYNDCDLFLRI